jgi:Uma2 family endonuclease
MPISTPPMSAFASLADLVERLGSIPLERIPAVPPPGSATEEDVLRRPGGEKRLYELVEGVLVEKPMGFYEARVAAVLIRILSELVDRQDLGIVVGADATMRLAPGLVRLPDVAFISWERFPDRTLPAEPIPDLAPDLAVEILSRGNTPAEMERKLIEYFEAGVRLVWYVDPEPPRVRVYTSPTSMTQLDEHDTLGGGTVVPGFQLPVREWFERAGRRPPSP